MSCAVERCPCGCQRCCGDRRYPPAPVREAELPLRGRGGAPRAGGAQLLRGERTRFVTLPKEVVEPVRLATARYRRARTRLETEGNSGLKALIEQSQVPS